MQIVILYLVTAAVFLVVDAIMLSLVMTPLFTRHIGHLMMDPIRYAPVVVFYLFYVAGVLALVSVPALRNGSGVWGPALLVGLLAYGTYEFTSYAIMRDWHWSMVIADTLWGGVLTAVSAWAGVTVTKTAFS